MEGLVFGIANINFQQNTVEFRDENRTPNCVQNIANSNMASAESCLGKSDETSTRTNQFNPNVTVSSNSSNDDNWQSEDELATADTATKGRTFAERRQLPSRASKESSLTGIKRRTIMKPAKHTSAIHKDFNNLKPADIKKIYLNKKITNFRPSSLETIFEEPANSAAEDIEECDQVRFIGARKLRRTLACNDGFVFNKALVKKRRAKIKKAFGRRQAVKKMSLEEFLAKFNNSMEDLHTQSENQISDNMEDNSDFSIQKSVSEADLKERTTSEVFRNIPVPLQATHESMDEECCTSMNSLTENKTNSLKLTDAFLPNMLQSK